MQFTNHRKSKKCLDNHANCKKQNHRTDLPANTQVVEKSLGWRGELKRQCEIRKIPYPTVSYLVESVNLLRDEELATDIKALPLKEMNYKTLLSLIKNRE